MAPRYLLDTNICIYIRSRRPAFVRSRFQQLEPGEASLSVITYGELRYGAEKSSSRDRAIRDLEQLAAAIPILPLPDDVADAYGRIRARLESKGLTIGNNDLWIAAHALAADLTLVTNNEREFRRISGLRIENWTKAA